MGIKEREREHTVFGKEQVRENQGGGEGMAKKRGGGEFHLG